MGALLNGWQLRIRPAPAEWESERWFWIGSWRAFNWTLTSEPVVVGWWRWKWRWTGGETPPMHRGHLPEPPSPIQPLPSADCALFPQPEAEKKQTTTENLPLKNTKEKPEQQRSGHPPPQHLGELLLFSGCSPRPLDIRGSRASRKRWRGRRKKKKYTHTHTQAAQRDEWWWGRGLTSLRDWLHVCGGCGGDAAAVYAGSDMVISPIHPRCSRLCAALPSDTLSSPPVVKCEGMRRSRNFR